MKKINKYFIIWSIIVVIIFILLTTFGLVYKNKSNEYKDIEKKLVEASKKYIDSKFLYPEKGKSAKILYKEIKEANFIDNLEKDGQSCDGYVVISSTGTVYNYKGYIKCENYTTKGY